MLMVSYLSWLFWVLVLSFIGSEWSDCGWEFRVMLMFAYLSWALVLSFTVGK